MAQVRAQRSGSSPSLSDLPGDLLCRIALGLHPDGLPPPPPCETELSPEFQGYDEEERRLEREGNEQRLSLAWEEFRARRQFLATFRCVCRAWRAALTEGATCLPAWLSPDAARRPVGPWKQRLRTLCLAVPGQVLQEHPDLAAWQQELAGELHVLYPNLMHLHFKVLDLMPQLSFLKWRIGRANMADNVPKWRGGYPARDRDVPPLVLDSELLPEGPVQLLFMHEGYEWTGRQYPRAEGGGWGMHSLELQGPLTLRTLMPLVERFFLDTYPKMREGGDKQYLKFSHLEHEGGGCLEMGIDFWPNAPRPYHYPGSTDSDDGDYDDWD